MIIRGTVEFRDGHKHEFMIDSDGTANWSQWGVQQPYSGACVDLLDGLAAAVAEHAEGAEDWVEKGAAADA